MSSRPYEYHRPTDLTQAVALLQRADVFTLALQFGPRIPLEPFPTADAVVDTRLLNLDRIRVSDDTIEIGSQVTLQQLVETPELNALANGIVAHAAQLAAHIGLRHLATVGGALAATDGPPELLLCLLALDATVSVQGATTREIALADFRPAPTELIVGVRFARSTPCRGAIARVARTPLDHAIVAAVATVTDQYARVAVAGASPQPVVETTTDVPLTTQKIQRAAAALANVTQPIEDYRGSAEYRRAMARVLTQRALSQAAQQG